MQNHDTRGASPAQPKNTNTPITTLLFLPRLTCRLLAVACLSHTTYQTVKYFGSVTQSGHVVDPLTALTCIAQMGMVAAMVMVIFINKSGWLQALNLLPLASMMVVVALQWRGLS